MKTLKDKKKFGKNKKPKNPNCRVFGIGKGKEYRKYERKWEKLLKHKKLFHIPLTTEEITKIKTDICLKFIYKRIYDISI